MNVMNLKQRRTELEQEIEKWKALLRICPEGRLFSRKQKDGSYTYTKAIFLPDGTCKEIYLKGTAHAEAALLARKRYAEKLLPELLQEKKLLDRLISLYSKGSAGDRFLKQHPGAASLLAEDALRKEDSLSIWKSAPYNRNLNYPEQLRYPTVVPGLLVRSKSEADIISRLEYFEVPYHYEELLIINNVSMAMDFTCRNRSTGQILYWDHRGMLDTPTYIQKTLNCDSQYLNAGIIPWKDLIVTTETKNHPLDLQWVDLIIHHFLL